MPPSASSTAPPRVRSAPVKAPFSWPNSSLSMSVGRQSPRSRRRRRGRRRAREARMQRLGDQLLAGAGLAVRGARSLRWRRRARAARTAGASSARRRAARRSARRQRADGARRRRQTAAAARCRRGESAPAPSSSASATRTPPTRTPLVLPRSRRSQPRPRRRQLGVAARDGVVGEREGGAGSQPMTTTVLSPTASARPESGPSVTVRRARFDEGARGGRLRVVLPAERAMAVMSFVLGRWRCALPARRRRR